MKIDFINIKPDEKFIKVSSDKKSDYDIYINNFIDIIESARVISTVLSHQISSNIICFDLQKLNKIFVKSFLNRNLQGLYTFNKYKTNNKNVLHIQIYAPQISDAQKNNFSKMFQSANVSRNLLNEPSNKYCPSIFANTVSKMFKNTKNVKVKILNENQIKKEKLGLINAIGNSSSNKARLLIIEYSPKNSKKTICLVGKGVTMDTGGYSIKSKSNMYNMHMDKTGASISVGLMKALAETEYKHKVIAILPLVENIVSDTSIKPGDVVTAYNGQTVEIVDVDAEGRLILADALSYACKNYEPDYILDFATLTGWSENIHCHTSFTFFTLNNNLSKTITKLGDTNAEKSFQIPAWIEYTQYLKSNKADVKNYGFQCMNSDGFMASIFLMNFIPPKFRNSWVHFDIRLLSSHNTLGVADGFSTYLDLLYNIQ